MPIHPDDETAEDCVTTLVLEWMQAGNDTSEMLAAMAAFLNDVHDKVEQPTQH